jgi:hypothetical protein
MTGLPWWKMWAGAVTDPKWLAIADVAGSTPAVVSTTFFGACDYACQHREDPGSLVGFELQDIASFVRVPIDEIRRVFRVLVERGMIVGNRIRSWAERQGVVVVAAARMVSAGALRTRRWRAKKTRDPRQSEMLFSIDGGAQQPASPVTSPASPRVTPRHRATSQAAPRGRADCRKGPPEPPHGWGGGSGPVVTIASDEAVRTVEGEILPPERGNYGRRYRPTAAEQRDEYNERRIRENRAEAAAVLAEFAAMRVA